MKKILFLSAATVIFAAHVQAQLSMLSAKTEKRTERKAEKKELRKLKGNVVSEASRQQFSRDFGPVTGVSWKRTVNFDEVNFKKNGKAMTAFYDDASNLVGTTSASTFANLPAKAKQFINKEYRQYNKGEVIFFDDNEKNETDMLLFGQQFDDEDSYFVQLKKDSKAIIVRVTKGGDVTYFARM